MAKNRQRTKYDIRSQTMTKSKNKKKKRSEPLTEMERDYLKYKKSATRKGFKKSEIFNFSRYQTVIAGDKARGRPGTPQDIIKRQRQEGLTDAELVARFEAIKKLSPEKYTNLQEFRYKKGWKDVDDEIYKLRLANPGMSSTDFALLITRTIYSPPME